MCLGGHPRSVVLPREDVHHGEYGEDEALPSPFIHAGVQGQIVELCRRGDRTVGQIAKDFDLTETAVRLWVSQAEVDAGERDGLTSSGREELAALRRENRRLREDVDILKRATAFFAKETRRRPNTPNSASTLGSRSTSPTPAAPGNVAPTRTQTDCCGSTSRRARTSPAGTPTSSRPSPSPSTADPARAWDGRHQQKPSTNTYYRSRKPVLRRPVEFKQYTSWQFASLAQEFGVRLSVGRTGQCWDNAPAEILLRHHQTRTTRHDHLAQPGQRTNHDLRLHRRLVQLAPAAQQPGLLRPRRIRDRTRILTTTPMVSVKAPQKRASVPGQRASAQYASPDRGHQLPTS